MIFEYENFADHSTRHFNTILMQMKMKYSCNMKDEFNHDR